MKDQMLTNGWPQPVPSWESGNYFNTAVRDGFAGIRVQARRADWVDYSSQRAVRMHGTCLIGCSCASAVAASFGKI